MSVIEKKRKKRVDHSLHVRLNALKQLDNGSTVGDIAENLEVSRCTIKKWMRNKDLIQAATEKMDDSIIKKSKRSVKLQNPEVDEAVWNWFQEKIKCGVPIDGKQLQMKASAIHKVLHGDSSTFSASNGWLDKFKRRHNLRNLKITGKKKSSDSKSVEEFVPFLAVYIKTEDFTEHPYE